MPDHIHCIIVINNNVVAGLNINVGAGFKPAPTDSAERTGCIKAACPFSIFLLRPTIFFSFPMLQWLMTYGRSTLVCSACKTTPLRDAWDNGSRNAGFVPELI